MGERIGFGQLQAADCKLQTINDSMELNRYRKVLHRKTHTDGLFFVVALGIIIIYDLEDTGSQHAAVEWPLHKLVIAIEQWDNEWINGRFKIINDTPKMLHWTKESWSNHKETSIKAPPSVLGPPFPGSPSEFSTISPLQFKSQITIYKVTTILCAFWLDRLLC